MTFIIVSNQSLLWLKNVLWKIKKIHSKSFRTKKTLEMEFCYIVWCNKQIIWLRTFSVLICYHTVHVYVVINVFDGVWSFLRGSESAGVLLLLIYICMVVDLYLYDCCWFISVWLLLIYICMVVVDLYLYGCCWFISVWLLLIYICMVVVDLYLYGCWRSHYQKRGLGIQLTCLTLPYVCAKIWISNVICYGVFCFDGLRWEVVVYFDNIGGIV